MKANTHVLDRSVPNLRADYPSVRAWAKRVFTKDRIEDVILTAATAANLGAILVFLYAATHAPTYTGFGYAVFGTF